MPIGFDPDETVRFSLAYDENKHADEKTRPAFVARFITARERAKVYELFKQHDAEPDAGKKVDILIEAAKAVIVRVENFGKSKDVAAALNLLTANELDEVTTKMLSQTRLTEIERGKSASVAASGGAAPAPSAQPANA